MKRKNIYRIATLVAVFVSLSACSSDYLDKMQESEGYDFDKVFKDSTNYYNYCNYLVVNPFMLHLQNGVKPLGNWDDMSDNSISTPLFTTVPSQQAQRGDFYALRTNGDADNCNNRCWEQLWKNIRITNTGIRNIEYYPGGETGRNKILGMCYFYRAFTYMELARRWGGMPYLYEPLDASAEMDIPRLSMQETYLLAAQDCDSAAMYLENVIPVTEFQFPTRIAALAIKSRILLYAASDQARTEPGSPGENLWEEAALAADEALKAAENNGYHLVEWGASLNGDDGYYYLFKDNQYETYIPEVLFGRRAQIAWGADAYIQTIRPPGTLAGRYGVAVNQLLVDCFEMQETGLPVNDLSSGYAEQNPYVGRDPRFYFNVLYNNSTVMTRTMEIWQEEEGKGVTGSTDCRVTAQGIPDQGYTSTGYYMKKWMGKTWNVALSQTWSYIRLAEVYLNFAEAANEAWGSPTAKDNRCKYSAVEACNIVRARAQMPDVASKFLNQNDFRERVRNERRVEFCFEEHRLFDLRRWLIGTQSENRDIWRMRITKLAPGYNAALYPTGFSYEKQLYLRRVFENRHNLFIIKLDDTRLGPNFKQNPGW
ncbi:MAG: RagB/SusD family nutrient uptake outer membrane protein [Tannerella sp.]|jgi:hypothetical protein|nr:RagB/SusD family nutrient uptake outer membrane protein [Tannerella sp.]